MVTRLERLTNGYLQVTTNIPKRVEDCSDGSLRDLSCADRDQDNLVDLWEEALLEHMSPMIRFQSDERALNGTILQLGRVSVNSDNIQEILLNIVTAYPRRYLNVSCDSSIFRGDLQLVMVKLTCLLYTSDAADE